MCTANTGFSARPKGPSGSPLSPTSAPTAAAAELPLAAATAAGDDDAGDEGSPATGSGAGSSQDTTTSKSPPATPCSPLTYEPYACARPSRHTVRTVCCRGMRGEWGGRSQTNTVIKMEPSGDGGDGVAAHLPPH